jgi:hypothetical protein
MLVVNDLRFISKFFSLITFFFLRNDIETSVINAIVNVGNMIISSVSSASDNSQFLVTFVSETWRDGVSAGMSALSTVQSQIVFSSILFFGKSIKYLFRTF